MSSALNLNEAPLPDDEDLNDEEMEETRSQLSEAMGDMGQRRHTFDLNFEQGHHHQPETELPTEATQHHQASHSRLSSAQRMQIFNSLLKRTSNGKLPHGAMKGAAEEFNVSARTISRLWKTAKQQEDASQCYNVSTKYQNCGRKRIEVDQDAVKALNMGDRTCIRDLANKLNISKTTCHRMVKQGFMKPHTNALHPGLSEWHKKTRLEWILMLLIGDTTETKTQYYPMYDFVHLDEKWFNQTRKTQRVYLAQDEKGKHRAASSSTFIPKVMFVVVVARPRFNTEGQCTFDVKIGIFPFIYQEPAKRASKNRDKGAIVTKLVQSVNKQVTRSMLINQIIPAIKAKWPQDGAHKIIFIQQHNAKAHITQQDSEWQQIYQQEAFTFILIQQPANSPDLNILDLGFFRSIQSLMHKKMPKNIDELLQAVHQAFYELDPLTLSDVWMTLQYVMNEILKSKGGNEYDMPHSNKKKLRAQGNLSREIKAPDWAINQAWQIVHGSAQAGTSNAQPHSQEADTQEEPEDNRFD